VNAALVLKAPLASPALTGTATASNLTVATNLLIGTTNVLTALGEKATTTALDLKAPKESPALTGTATAANLTVATNLLIGTTNVLTTLNSKANTSDTYTRTQVANLFQPLITTFGSPLRCDVNILSGLSTLSIEETAALVIGDIESSGTLSIDTIEAKLSDHIQVNNNFTVAGNTSTNGNVDVDGTLTVAGFYAHKPYTAFYTNGSGVISATIKPGYIIPTLSRTVMGTYVYTLPTAHPSGNLYEVFVQQRKATATTALAQYGVSVISSTQFTVWSTTYLNVLVDSDFYLHTVP
jgi:hypothetical protein